MADAAHIVLHPLRRQDQMGCSPACSIPITGETFVFRRCQRAGAKLLCPRPARTRTARDVQPSVETAVVPLGLWCPLSMRGRAPGNGPTRGICITSSDQQKPGPVL